jgi:hypothetical protein
MVMKGCDVVSHVGNANVGHSEINFVFDNRHRRASIELIEKIKVR